MLRLVILVLAIHSVNAQIISPVDHLNGIGPSGIATDLKTSFFESPISMISYEKPTIETGYYMPYSQNHIGMYTAAITLPFEKFTIGSGVSRYGSEVMHSNQIIIQGAFNRKNFVFGSAIKLSQLYMKEAGSYHTFSIDLSGRFNISETSAFAASVKNFTQSTWNNSEETPSYSEYRLAFGHEISNKVTIHTALKSSSEDNLTAAIAMTSVLNDLFRIDLGSYINPASIFGGIHFEYQRIKINYNTQWIPRLPFHHGINLQVSIK
ncbi:hypothetical protein [Marinigracilibium pacificum]|uniref:Type IX secretion system PorP/SprF family membrane protein n=1 Tax=Marinigracilibium pacificum TaxID=2729599 RepID=A0A848IXW5_9BACT|nr:hypothetical protein [Marinigracilibium pacificum]NMM49137.1 hypothetical protein [Marinigracilibium pacificum]